MFQPMAGLLTLSSLLGLPSHHDDQWLNFKQALIVRRLQLQVQFRIPTGFPHIVMLAVLLAAITIGFAPQNYNISINQQH